RPRPPAAGRGGGGALRQRGRSWITKIDPVEIREELGPHLDLAGDDPLRRTLRLLGLFVEGATREAFAAVSGLPREQVELELGLAEACGWLRARGGCLSFEDPALGRALAAEIPEAERPALHHRIARFLAGSKEGAPELLAYHWQHAWPEAPGE